VRFIAILALLAGIPLSAQQPGRFSDVSGRSGLKIAANTGVGGTNPHAVAVEDFNGDGLADVILLTFGKPHIYYFRNRGQLRFEDITRGSGLENFAGEGTGAAAADFDGDGILDLYLTSLRNGESRLYKGNKDGTFSDVSARAGVLLKSPARSCAWSDVDGDGWPDLYVCCPEGPNLLFRNNRDGTFTNIARAAGVELVDRHSLGCVFGDVDGDGRDDLFVSNYRSQPSALFRNDGNGKFTDMTVAAGLSRRASAVGCVFADVFNTGRLDLLVTTDSWLSGANYTETELLKMKHTVEPNLLYRNDAGGKFTPVAGDFSTLKTLSHDAIIEDLDHDGLPDIYVTVDAESGNRWATSKGGNRLWTRPGGKNWQEASRAWGIHHEANCVCAAAADFDNDGDLDLLLVNFYSQPVLYRNETNNKNWLRVKVNGKAGNRHGLGARISLWDDRDGKRRLVGTRHIHSGAGYCRSSPLEAHCGLGNSPSANYRLEVRFPVTRKSIIRESVAPGQRIVINE